jgi:hypothetical protein
MFVIVVPMLAATGIGAGLRIERRLDDFDMASKPLDHRPDHVIGLDTDAIPQ